MIKTIATILVLAMTALATPAYSGSLSPPGPPSPTMKPLDVVEPRTPISSLPFTISQSGSYYLTRDLTISGSGNGITILSAAVGATLDLKGYALIGSGASASSAILVQAGENVSIRNGTVRGWAYGITANGGSGTRLSQIISTGNSTDGFNFTGGGEVLDCTVTGNGQFGISTWDGVTVRDSQVTNNGWTGVLLNGYRNSIESSLVSGNGYSGFTGQYYWRAGIWAHTSSRVVGCNVHSNAWDGIIVGNGNQISDNHSTGNGFSGISTISGNGNRIEGNHLWGNSSMGIYIGGAGNILMRNTASGNTQGSFSVVGGNVAPVENGTLTNVASNVSF